MKVLILLVLAILAATSGCTNSTVDSADMPSTTRETGRTVQARPYSGTPYHNPDESIFSCKAPYELAELKLGQEVSVNTGTLALEVKDNRATITVTGVSLYALMVDLQPMDIGRTPVTAEKIVFDIARLSRPFTGEMVAACVDSALA